MSNVPEYEVGDVVRFYYWENCKIVEINQSKTKFLIRDDSNSRFWAKEDELRLIRKVTPLEKALL